MAEPTPHQAGVQIQALDELVTEVLTDLRQRGQTPEFPTGIPLLDEAIWGLHRGELAVIAARPGAGKTTLALQIGRELADRQKKVLFLSLEMTRQQLVERLLVQWTQTNAWDLRTGKHVDELELLLAPMRPMLPHMNLRVADGIGYTINQVQHCLHKLEADGGGAPDVLMIDFIQLIALEQGLQRFDAIAEYIRALKELAIQYRMAVVICSQINRESSKNAEGRPTLANLKSSGAIEELADVVIMCWWKALGTEEKPQGYKYLLLVEKNRHGLPGQQIPVHFDADKLTFRAVAEEISAWTPPNGHDSDTAPLNV